MRFFYDMKIIFSVLFLSGLTLAGCGTNAKPAAQNVSPPSRPQTVAGETENEVLLKAELRKREEAVRVAEAKVVSLTAENAKAEAQITSLTGEVEKAERLAGKNEATANGLRTMLTVTVVFAIVGFFVGVGMGSSTRRKFQQARGAVGRGGGRE